MHGISESVYIKAVSFQSFMASELWDAFCVIGPNSIA